MLFSPTMQILRLANFTGTEFCSFQIPATNATLACFSVTVQIFDMRNELDVRNVVFEILAKNSVQIPLFPIVFSIVKSFITV